MRIITFCPKCKKSVEAKDYLSDIIAVGFLDSILPKIKCKCGYAGLPLQLDPARYKKLIKKSDKS